MKKPSVLPTNAPYYPYEIRDILVGGIRFCRGQAKHGMFKAYNRRGPPGDPNEVHGLSSLPRDALFAEETPGEYRGLPVPISVSDRLFGRVVPKHLRIGINKTRPVPTSWCLGLNDPVAPDLFVLFPSTQMPAEAHRETADQDLGTLPRFLCGPPRLSIRRLHIWRDLVPTHPKDESHHSLRYIKYFLQVPRPFVVPTKRELLMLDVADERFRDGVLPKLAPFVLLYTSSTVLLYVRHSFETDDMHQYLPRGLRELRGCKWLGYERSLDSPAFSVRPQDGKRLPRGTHG